MSRVQLKRFYISERTKRRFEVEMTVTHPALTAGELTASASLDADRRAEAAAKQLGIPKAYGSYAEMFADPEIEAVYNPLPNHLHVPVTLEAMKAGKHVLCEKPIALTAAEAEQLEEAERASGKLVAEAFMVRWHPQWLKARELVAGTPGACPATLTRPSGSPARNALGSGATRSQGRAAVSSAMVGSASGTGTGSNDSGCSISSAARWTAARIRE